MKYSLPICKASMATPTGRRRWGVV